MVVILNKKLVNYHFSSLGINLNIIDMLEPKEKADSLIEYFLEKAFIDIFTAKTMAIKVVDEIIKSKPQYPIDYSCTDGYWQQVKQHIEEYGK